MEEKTTKRGKRCVAFGCGNTHINEGISLHAFPHDTSIHRQWVSFVRTKRAKWEATKHSVLCSEHFTETCYPAKYSLMKSMGCAPPKKRTLLDAAVPTIHVVIEDSQDQSPPSAKKPRTAFIKRENNRITKEYTEKIGDMQMTEAGEAGTVTTSCTGTDDAFTDEDISPSSITTEKAAVKHCGTQLTFKGPNKRSAYIQVTPHSREKGSQTKPPKMKSVGIQCEILRPHQTDNSEEEDLNTTFNSTKSDMDMDLDMVDQAEDPDESFHISEAELMDVSDVESDLDVNEDCFYIIGRPQLLDLFDVCRKCSSQTYGEVVCTVGSMVKIQQDCSYCGHLRKWNSQSMVGAIPAANVKLSCAILFTGSLPSKSLRLLNFMNMPTISNSTFLSHQRHYLFPSIMNVWEDQRAENIEKVKRSQKPLCVGGDGRCDTPGHSAKYGSYSLMDLDSGTLLAVELVQSNEVKNSVHMEKEGLIRCVDFLDQNGIKIDTIITDRHVMIRKWVRENLKDTRHRIDV